MIALSRSALRRWQTGLALSTVAPVRALAQYRQRSSSEGLADSAGWNLGSVLIIYGRPMTVTGTFRTPGVAVAAVYMPLESARDLFGPDRLTQIVTVQVALGADGETVSARLAADPEIAGRFVVFYEDTYTRRNTELLRNAQPDVCREQARIIGRGHGRLHGQRPASGRAPPRKRLVALVRILGGPSERVFAAAH
jgi:hypothetical protein